MRRERALQVVLVVVGLIFLAGSYPLLMFFSRDPGVAMIMSIYVTMGIFLLLSVSILRPTVLLSLLLDGRI